MDGTDRDKMMLSIVGRVLVQRAGSALRNAGDTERSRGPHNHLDLHQQGT